MKTDDYVKYDALGLAGLIRRGEVTAPELLACARSVTEKKNPALNAVIETWEEPDRSTADTDGPFDGVPFLIKDIGAHAAGRRQEMGSRLAKDLVIPHDSHLMENFRSAGLVTFGRAATPEFGWNVTTESLVTGPTRNPWDTTRMAGGSSGGPAAAVAAGIVPMAHANDGAGSIRIPAACCGLVGLKPSRGRLPAGPDAGELLLGLGVEFVVTRTVRDAAAALKALHGGRNGDWYVIEPPKETVLDTLCRPLRIGWTTKPWHDVPVDAEVAAAVVQAAKTCEALGHEVTEASPTFDYEVFDSAAFVLYAAVIAGAVAATSTLLGRKADLSTLEACTLAVYEEGRSLSAVALMDALARANMVNRAVAPFFDHYDILLTPTLALPPQPLGTYDQNAAGMNARDWFDHIIAFTPFCALFNMTGQPAITLPLGRTQTGLPLGCHFVGRLGAESTLLALAANLEIARPWPKLAP
jgi:amidase